MFVDAWLWVMRFIFLFYRERYEVLVDKEIGRGNISGHHQSRDSAIDTEVHDCETEICEIDLVNNPKHCLPISVHFIVVRSWPK